MTYIDLDSGTILNGPIVYVDLSDPEIEREFEEVADGPDSDIREFGEKHGKPVKAE